MGFIVAIPAIIALYWAIRYSAASAFISVYLPVLLLLPEYYRWSIPGLPDPTFSQAAILPIALICLPKALGVWRWSLADFLILGFAGCVALSEYENSGYNEAQNLMFDMLASVVLPYIVAKALIEPNGLRVAFARKFAFLIFAVCVISVYEFRFGRTPWQNFLNPFFPGQGEAWVTTFRYGFARVAGPYGHAILGGLIIIVGYRIQRWLEWGGYWEPTFKYLRWLKIPKARLMTLGIAMGILMTLVRGPWAGGVAGVAIAMIGRAKNRRKAMVSLCAVIILIGIPAGASFYSYASVGRANAKSDSQETAAYRIELIEKYIDTALQRSALGWGRNTWPRVEGMPSIDNYYLLLALMHGFIADGFLLAIFLTMIYRLIRFEMRGPPVLAVRNSLGFTLAAIYLGIGVTIATVYMGLAVTPVFAIITGWSEGYLLSNRRSLSVAGPVAQQAPVAAFAFRRVVA
jgi:hypothetical protein